MLGNIKSSYIIKKIFTYIHDKTLLELIKYNKNFQNVLNIGIINYKIFGGKSIIFESNGKGKEYNNYNNKLIFEGEYIYGKRHGIGKEYDCDGKLLFEGKYLNNKRNGNGKEYFSNGNVKFEGKYLNGKKWTGVGYDQNNQKMFEIENGNGYIKGYIYNNDYSIFEGEYLNGEKNGNGKEYFNSVLQFEGEYLNDKRNKKGTEYYIDFKSKKFEGVYFYGKEWDGKGYNKNNRIIYELKNGKGIVKEYCTVISLCSEYDKYILIFECEYLNGEKNGKGKEYNSNGHLIFEGEYLNNKKNGNGKEYDSEGNLIFEGQYLYDHKRFGKEFNNGHLKYEGEYLYDKKWNGKIYDIKGNIYEIINGNGKVKEYDENNSELILFDGKYINGIKKGIYKEYLNNYLQFEGESYNLKRNGKGKEYYYGSGIVKFDGEYKNGFKNGKGKEYNSEGELMFEGEYKDDIKNGKGKEYYKGKLMFEGEYKNGHKNGIGKEYDITGEIIFEGMYLNDERSNQKGKKENFNYTNKKVEIDIKDYNIKSVNKKKTKKDPCFIF